MRTNLRPFSALWLVFALAALPLLAGCHSASQAASPAPATALDPVSSPAWIQDMARFAAEDAANPPPAAPVVFTGSSSVRLWTTLREDFPGIPVLNRGFGGSQVRDSVWYAEQLVVRYRPRQVLVYAGDNDIDAGRTPAQVLSDFQALVARLRRDLPGLRIGFIAIKPSPLRLAQLPMQRAANDLVRDWAATREGIDFIDVSTPMLDARGRPDARLFGDDGLHMNGRLCAVAGDRGAVPAGLLIRPLNCGSDLGRDVFGIRHIATKVAPTKDSIYGPDQ